MLFAELPFDRFITILVYGIHIRPDSLQFRLGIKPAVAGRYQRTVHISYGLYDVSAFILTEHGMVLALEVSDIGIVPQDDIQIAEF